MLTVVDVKHLLNKIQIIIARKTLIRFIFLCIFLIFYLHLSDRLTKAPHIIVVKIDKGETPFFDSSHIRRHVLLGTLTISFRFKALFLIDSGCDAKVSQHEIAVSLTK